MPMTDEPGGVEAPRPPGVSSPPLAVYKPKRREWIAGLVLAPLLMLVFALFRGGREWLVSSWVPWAIVVSPGVLIAVGLLGTTVSAGSNWLYLRELWYRRWVALDQLTEVDVRPNGPKLRIRLRDAQGHKLVTRLDNLQAEPAVWQLVHASTAQALTTSWCKRNPQAERTFAR